MSIFRKIGENLIDSYGIWVLSFLCAFTALFDIDSASKTTTKIVNIDWYIKLWWASSVKQLFELILSSLSFLIGAILIQSLHILFKWLIDNIGSDRETPVNIIVGLSDGLFMIATLSIAAFTYSLGFIGVLRFFGCTILILIK